LELTLRSTGAAQAALVKDLVAPDGRVWMLADGDEAGARCAESLLVQVSPHRFTRLIKLDPGKQPTDYSLEDLARILTPEGAS
jgi:hypothetical protein